MTNFLKRCVIIEFKPSFISQNNGGGGGATKNINAAVIVNPTLVPAPISNFYNLALYLPCELGEPCFTEMKHKLCYHVSSFNHVLSYN